CGLMSLAINSRQHFGTFFGAVVTFLLGAAFLNLELREFQGMVAMGAAPQRSAFLSAFFTLVGCHGLHVAIGLAWLVLMMVQLSLRGCQQVVVRRLHCFSLFWHALDIIWVLIFTIVYLMVVLPCTTRVGMVHRETGRRFRPRSETRLPPCSCTRSACCWQGS